MEGDLVGVSVPSPVVEKTMRGKVKQRAAIYNFTGEPTMPSIPKRLLAAELEIGGVEEASTLTGTDMSLRGERREAREQNSLTCSTSTLDKKNVQINK